MKNRKLIFSLIAILVLFILAIAYLFRPTNNSGDNEVKVYVENGTSIVYQGVMADDGVKKVKELYNKNINRLVINSEGGDINIGMDLGEWVYDKKLDVEVRTKAFSSAANYVFTAGKTKYLHKDSMVGWHGGATQQGEGWLYKLLSKNYVKKAKVREEAFFNKIGVQQRSTVYGQRPEFNKYSDSKYNYVGWTYSLEAMKALGINNIVLLDDKWTPSDEFNGKKIFTVTDVEPLNN